MSSGFRPASFRNLALYRQAMPGPFASVSVQFRFSHRRGADGLIAMRSCKVLDGSPRMFGPPVGLAPLTIS